ncbi:MAG TPA: TonB-dependent receptor, partial [Rhodanobacter sp.]|nr:TonB-dependent receptor [Rhodanobacter sp.]
FTSFSTSSATFDQVYSANWVSDLSVSYNLDHWTFTLGADNLFDKYPDKVNAINGYGANKGTMPYSVYSPYGFNGGYAYGKVAYHW